MSQILNDTIKRQPLTLAEKYAVQENGLDSRQRKHPLPQTMQMAIGMKVMLAQNIVSDLDITNGALDIWLHPEELAITDLNTTVILKHRAYSGSTRSDSHELGDGTGGTRGTCGTCKTNISH